MRCRMSTKVRPRAVLDLMRLSYADAMLPYSSMWGYSRLCARRAGRVEWEKAGRDNARSWPGQTVEMSMAGLVVNMHEHQPS